MSSTDYSEDLQIERDLPTTEADILTLRQLRHDRGLTFAEALDLLSSFDLIPTKRPERIAGEDWEPFQL